MLTLKLAKCCSTSRGGWTPCRLPWRAIKLQHDVREICLRDWRDC